MIDQNGNEPQIDNKSSAPDDMVVKKLAMRAVPKKELECYLIKKAEKIEDNVYYGDGWQVSLSPERQDKLGSCFIVAVDVTLSVKSEIFDAFLLNFRKNFLRGGG
ncbi:MAG: hypothetical protein ACOH15_01455 [Acetobacterium sp.]